MKTSLTHIFAIAVAALSLFSASAAGKWMVPKEKLTYDVMYKWGLINKKAGSATITTYPDASPSEFRAHLSAASASWADRFYMVRDTLKGSINKETFFPSYYEKIAHEGGAYDRDVLHYTRTTDTVTATAKMWRKRKKEKEIRQLEAVHTATGATMDMLSAFYYMRRIPYDTMRKGEAVSLNVFSGKKKETLTIHYDGLETIEIDKKWFACYHITFTFTTGGGKVSSDNMDAWISTGRGRIPLLLEGKLPVGKVRAIYSGALPSD